MKKVLDLKHLFLIGFASFFLCCFLSPLAALDDGTGSITTEPDRSVQEQSDISASLQSSDQPEAINGSMDEQLPQDKAPSTSPSPTVPVLNMENIDLEQLQKVLLNMMVDFQKKKEETRRRLLSLLPQDDHALIAQARESYQEFIEEVNLCNGLARACAIISTKLNEYLQQDDQLATILQPLINTCERLHQGLLDGSFVHILNNGQEPAAQGLVNPMQLMQGMSGMPGAGVAMKIPDGAALSLSVQDINEFCDTLHNAKMLIAGYDDAQLVQAYNVLCIILSAVKHNDMQKVTTNYLEHLNPCIEKTRATLVEITATLDKKIAGLPLEGDTELRRAYVLLTNELRGYLRTLTVFASLRESSGFFVANTHTLFNLISYSFGFYENLFKLYKLDNNGESFRGWMLDKGLRSALATWHFFMQKADFSNGLLFNTIQGNAPMAALTPMQLLMHNAILAPFSLFIFVNPNFWNKKIHGSVRELGKVLSVWVYYHVFHCRLFNEAQDGETSFCCQEGGTVWPAEYKHLRSAIFSALNEGQRYVFDEIHQYIRFNVYPQKIEQVERATMGIIKPELLGYIFETFLPIIMLSQKELVDHVARYKRTDFYDGRFAGLVRGYYLRSNPSAGNIADMNIIYDHYADRPELNIEAYYVECRLISYLCSSIGSHWGRFFARKYQNSLSAAFAKGAEKTVKFCAKIGLISQETAALVHDAKNEFNEGMEEFIGVFKELFKGVFMPGSPVRAMVVPLLERRGDIANKDNADSLAVTREVLNLIVEKLAQFSFISYVDGNYIKEAFEKDHSNTDVLVDKIVEAVRANTIAWVGGQFGSWVMTSFVGMPIMRNYGPFYPKVQQWAHGA